MHYKWSINKSEFSIHAKLSGFIISLIFHVQCKTSVSLSVFMSVSLTIRLDLRIPKIQGNDIEAWTGKPNNMIHFQARPINTETLRPQRCV